MVLLQYNFLNSNKWYSCNIFFFNSNEWYSCSIFFCNSYGPKQATIFSFIKIKRENMICDYFSQILNSKRSDQQIRYLFKTPKLDFFVTSAIKITQLTVSHFPHYSNVLHFFETPPVAIYSLVSSF